MNRDERPSAVSAELLSHRRREYRGRPIGDGELAPDPFVQFGRWFEEAEPLEIDPTAMALATVAGDGRTSLRTVLLKGVEAGGFVFFTNYESRKGRDIAATGRASLLFLWLTLERQVRIEGRVERVSTQDSDAYFATRPLGSRLAAHASSQSARVESRAALDAAFDAARQRFPGPDVPRPDAWGGYRVVPDEFEFWQGRESRLHDRIHYLRRPSGGWEIERLAP
ncbi:MAG: pyridoxamine 5'-phosphate oxidase [Vicinamibacterales bacterium]